MITTPRLPMNRHFDCMRLCQKCVWGCRPEDSCELLKPKTELAAPAQPDVQVRRELLLQDLQAIEPLKPSKVQMDSYQRLHAVIATLPAQPDAEVAHAEAQLLRMGIRMALYLSAEELLEMSDGHLRYRAGLIPISEVTDTAAKASHG